MGNSEHKKLKGAQYKTQGTNSTNEQEELSLTNCWSSWKDYIVNHPNQKNIRILSLQNNQINESDVDSIMKFEWPCLTNFNVANNHIGANAWKILVYKWNSLNALNLYNNQISSSGLFGVCDSSLHSLKQLNLSNNPIGCKGVKLLVRSNFNSLQYINLSSCRIGNSGVKNLTKCPWPSLQIIELDKNYIGASGYQSLVCCYLTRLSEMSLRDNEGNWQFICAVAVDAPVRFSIYWFSNYSRGKWIQKNQWTIINNRFMNRFTVSF